MPDQKPTLGYASSDETQASDRDRAGRYFREPPSMGAIVVIIAMVFTLLACSAMMLVRRIFP
jgi:hypothetical protein